ncbi:AAA family ATPase [Curtobacterium sp. MCLR17_045]|uniref:AAA family ATPase n=1 Tax=Curtobacterium sp. MCLR17_045 TaxID=2175629 RepID=UPI0035C89BCD
MQISPVRGLHGAAFGHVIGSRRRYPLRWCCASRTDRQGAPGNEGVADAGSGLWSSRRREVDAVCPIAELTPSLTLRVDAIEGAMWKYQIPPEQSGIAAYSVMHAIAVPNLRRGQVVIADAVSGVEPARAGWASTAEAAGVSLRVIEVVCADVNEHRRRVEQRANDLPGFTLPTWDEVQRVADEYEPRTDDRLVIDSTRPLEETVRQALDYLELHVR